MAETTKLANTFKAWRFTIGVKPHNLDGAIKRCEELGLQPKVCGYQPDDVGILFSVIVPRCVCVHPQPDFMQPHMSSFHGALVHGAEMKLICPLPDVEAAAAVVKTSKFPVWKTIKLGTGSKNADDFRKAIKDCGMKIGDWANDILGKPEFTVA
ncbi:MAG: hypothetical protein CEN87_712, partial [Parcubacteria group bacterium Licking1014_1]